LAEILLKITQSKEISFSTLPNYCFCTTWQNAKITSFLPNIALPDSSRCCHLWTDSDNFWQKCYHLGI